MADLMDFLSKMLTRTYNDLFPNKNETWEERLARQRASGWNPVPAQTPTPTPSPTPNPGSTWDKLNNEQRKGIVTFYGSNGPFSNEQIAYYINSGDNPGDELVDEARRDAGPQMHRLLGR